MSRRKITLEDLELQAFLQGPETYENFKAVTTPGGIERQERQGQRDLTTSTFGITRLPTEGLDPALFRKIGFDIIGPLDALFSAVTAPAGWTLRPTEHSMYSEIVDAKGHARGSVFYKAAFYDKRADVHLYTRYYVTIESPGDDLKRRFVVKDRQTGTVVAASGWSENYEGREVVFGILDHEFPDWQNVLAYWD